MLTGNFLPLTKNLNIEREAYLEVVSVEDHGGCEGRECCQDYSGCSIEDEIYT